MLNAAAEPAIQPYLNAIGWAEVASKCGQTGATILEDDAVTIQVDSTGRISITVDMEQSKLYGALLALAVDRSRPGLLTQSTPVFQNPEVSYVPQ